MALYRFSPTAFIRTVEPLRINALRSTALEYGSTTDCGLVSDAQSPTV
jgi:hypothetical protein